jgi:capsular polysaccharide biosynthesis protein
MRNFLIGFVLGIVVATIGFTGIAKFMDKGVGKIQHLSREITK